MYRYRYFLFLLLLLVVSGCTSAYKLFRQQSAYEKYEQAIKDLNLNSSIIGKKWLDEGENAIKNPLSAVLPYKEIVYFSPDKPMAASYLVHIDQGEKLVISVKSEQDSNSILFIDVFKFNKDVPELAASADTNQFDVEYESDNTGKLLVRIQPELLGAGEYTVTMETQPALSFPVKGKSSAEIRSTFGAPRDNGERRHEGIDLFAPKRTPVMAVSDGIVSAVGTNTLGGKVVSIADLKRHQTYYFAHLDKQLVTVGQKVKPGDVVGLIGNTGNAENTPPHLHFGIYTFESEAVDPYPFLHTNPEKPSNININEELLGEWVRVKAKKAYLTDSPEYKSGRIARVSKNEPLMVTGGSNNWYRVMNASGQDAYVPASAIEKIVKPVSNIKLDKTLSLLYNDLGKTVVIGSLKPKERVSVLAVSKNMLLVKNSDNKIGWIIKS